MPIYAANRRNFTPSAVQNWCLVADAAGDHALVKSVHWGGAASASAPAATRWGRASTEGTAPSSLATPQIVDTHTQAAGCTFCTTTAPVITAAPDGFYVVDWNAFGGLGRYNMDDEEGWQIQNGISLKAQIICVNDVNTTAGIMSCGVVWKE